MTFEYEAMKWVEQPGVTIAQRMNEITNWITKNRGDARTYLSYRPDGSYSYVFRVLTKEGWKKVNPTDYVVMGKMFDPYGRTPTWALDLATVREFYPCDAETFGYTGGTKLTTIHQVRIFTPGKPSHGILSIEDNPEIASYVKINKTVDEINIPLSFAIECVKAAGYKVYQEV